MDFLGAKGPEKPGGTLARRRDRTFNERQLFARNQRAFARRALRRRRLAPCLVAQLALACRAVAVAHHIVRSAPDLWPGLRPRTHAPVRPPPPPILKQILRIVAGAANLVEAPDTVAVGEPQPFAALGGQRSILRIGTS